MTITILVPQGAEYQAINAGLKRVHKSHDLIDYQILAIPMGMQSLEKYLQQEYLQYLEQSIHHPQNQVLIMGLCGSLNPKYQIGDVVLYENCLYQGKIAQCDQKLTANIYHCLGEQVSLVKGITSDRIISTHQEKETLYQKYQTDVVDMEGFTALEFFQKIGIPITILRVISDDAQHDIPNLTSIISGDGSVQILPLMWQFCQQPIAATQLIKGSLIGLKKLTEIATKLFKDPRLL